ncbi:MAG: hypothetical protein CMM78_12075 [Rhodospirillaceae bacterium]|nr:hypothetical protein [Rhodospirillales bacterium]MAX48939.1 hypothetical protein [Rhodospirillaceae bacterium]
MRLILKARPDLRVETVLIQIFPQPIMLLDLRLYNEVEILVFGGVWGEMTKYFGNMPTGDEISRIAIHDHPVF